jgi:hypothetical protein
MAACSKRSSSRRVFAAAFAAVRGGGDGGDGGRGGGGLPPPPPPPPPPNRHRLDPVNKDEIRQFMHSETAEHSLGFLVITNSLSSMVHRSVRDGPSSISNTSTQADGLFDLALHGSSCLEYAAGNSRLESYRSAINELWPHWRRSSRTCTSNLPTYPIVRPAAP